MSRLRKFVAILLLMALAGCTSGPAVRNPNGMRTVDVVVGTSGPVHGIGIEGKDIVAMTDRMARDLLSASFMQSRSGVPRIILDAKYFVNESSQRISKDTITDRLRVELNRAAIGRMLFVARESSGMVAEERELKREGLIDTATTGLTHAQAGGDYRLTGRISSLDSRDPRSGLIQRYNSIVFELVDLESGVVAWSNMYEFERASADDVIYR
jgi:hypothetical protein